MISGMHEVEFQKSNSEEVRQSYKETSKKKEITSRISLKMGQEF